MTLPNTKTINLHTIFRYLVNNDNFLLSIEEVNEKLPNTKKKQMVNLMNNMITDFTVLSPYEIQEYQTMPPKLKSYLNPKYSRVGIKNVTEKNLNIVNVSFLNSLNIILRPELFRISYEEQIKNVGLLENFIAHKISRNYQIDKVKNTSKVKAKNRVLIDSLAQGKITPEIIQYIVNIYEINIAIFDMNKSEFSLYWTSGIKFPYFNFFREIYFMTHIQGNYEPVVTLDTTLESEEIHKIYTNILIHSDEIKFNVPLNLSVISLSYIETWNIPLNKYLIILEKFYNKSNKTIDECIEEFNTLKKLMGRHDESSEDNDE